jgi:hypothetical protein
LPKTSLPPGFLVRGLAGAFLQAHGGAEPAFDRKDAAVKGRGIRENGLWRRGVSDEFLFPRNVAHATGEACACDCCEQEHEDEELPRWLPVADERERGRGKLVMHGADVGDSPWRCNQMVG